MSEWTVTIMAAVGVLFIGIAKAGFGGSLGMLTTPLCVVAFGAQGKYPSFALGVILPLLCLGDVFSMYHYWGKWDKKNLKCLLPGVVLGVFAGAFLIGRFTPRQLNVCIGLIAVLFVIYQVARKTLSAKAEALKPSPYNGWPFGIAAGVTSTFAHGAGPVVSIYLIAQHLPKEVFMGTTVLTFTWINWIKMPFFVANGIVTPETLLTGLKFSLLVPVGVWIGLWLNRQVSEVLFARIAYTLVFCAGIYLLWMG
jgi:uncharacterized membrane protein YfcA